MLPGEADDVVVKREGLGLGKEFIHFASESGLGAPCEAVLVILPFGPLRERDDVGGIVLVTAQVDGLTALALEALGESVAEFVDDLLGALGPGLQVGGDMPVDVVSTV